VVGSSPQETGRARQQRQAARNNCPHATPANIFVFVLHAHVYIVELVELLSFEGFVQFIACAGVARCNAVYLFMAQEVRPVNMRTSLAQDTPALFQRRMRRFVNGILLFTVQ
jgi:hypothetical protein